jgi:hypothetical protein
LKRVTLIVVVCMLGMLSLSSVAGASGPGWHSEQPVADGIGVPVPLGPVSGIAFWSPNKGVLVTEGTGGTPAGVYAYDGNGWYLYSTVCGGHEGGGIAISGPDEFWTISNYAEAQEGINGVESKEWNRTLCHFANGEVVASYAEPAASAGAYSRMGAAACSSPTDCWFAGEALPKTAANKDPFHLHWNGFEPIPVPSSIALEPEVTPMLGKVEGLAFARGRLFESSDQAPFLREVSLADPHRFLSVEPLTPTPGPFVLSSEPFQQELWAGSSEGAVLHLGPAGFETVPIEPPIFERAGVRGLIEAIGAEPGTEAAWLGGGSINGEAEVRRVTAGGALGPIVNLPEPAEELNPKGQAEQIVCPATNQCWMVTNKGWLFHLGGPPAEGVNADPLMHRLITIRPKDNSTRSFVEAGLPPDDSGESEAKTPPIEKVEPFPEQRPARPVVYDVHQKLVGKRVLELSFKLRASAHVQLKAKYHKKVVAKTPRRVLGKGPHQLRLKLDPKQWPTGLAFQVNAVKKRSK